VSAQTIRRGPPALITPSQRAAPHPSVNTSAEYSFSRVTHFDSEVGHGLSQHTRDRVEPWCLLQRTRAPRCGMHQWTSCRLLANSMFAKHLAQFLAQSTKVFRTRPNCEYNHLVKRDPTRRDQKAGAAKAEKGCRSELKYYTMRAIMNLHAAHALMMHPYVSEHVFNRVRVVFLQLAF
jgi:hypothetical protein